RRSLVDVPEGQRLGLARLGWRVASRSERGSVRSAAGDIHPRLRALMLAARHYGIVLDPTDCGCVSPKDIPPTRSLCSWVQDAGLRARAVRLRWRQLVRIRSAGPVVLLFADGSAGLMTSADADHNVIFLKDPCAPASAAAIAVDELRLERVWSGEAVLLR